MHKYGSKDLLGDVKYPNLERSLRPFPPSFVYERE
jgi:hypothetical protein